MNTTKSWNDISFFEERATEQRAESLKARTCKCGGVSEGDNVPVTTGGWHGDISYGWGRYAGVHLCKAVRYRCPACGETRSANPDWDR